MTFKCTKILSVHHGVCMSWICTLCCNSNIMHEYCEIYYFVFQFELFLWQNLKQFSSPIHMRLFISLDSSSCLYPFTSFRSGCNMFTVKLSRSTLLTSATFFCCLIYRLGACGMRYTIKKKINFILLYCICVLPHLYKATPHFNCNEADRFSGFLVSS